MLLKHGANPNTRDDVGLTPLHWAVVRGNKVCILKLFEKGAEIHAKTMGAVPRVIWLLSSKALVPGSVRWKKRAALLKTALGGSAMGVRTA
jgi:hypothetical protein